jgi:hypothetical protein
LYEYIWGGAETVEPQVMLFFSSTENSKLLAQYVVRSAVFRHLQYRIEIDRSSSFSVGPSMHASAVSGSENYPPQEFDIKILKQENFTKIMTH